MRSDVQTSQIQSHRMSQNVNMKLFYYFHLRLGDTDNCVSEQNSSLRRSGSLFHQFTEMKAKKKNVC